MVHFLPSLIRIQVQRPHWIWQSGYGSGSKTLASTLPPSLPSFPFSLLSASPSPLASAPFYPLPPFTLCLPILFSSFSVPDPVNPDPDPDPGILLNLDPDPGCCWSNPDPIRIRIQTKIFYDKIAKNSQFVNFFAPETVIFLDPPQKTFRLFKHEFFFLSFLGGQFWPAWFRMRVISGFESCFSVFSASFCPSASPSSLFHFSFLILRLRLILETFPCLC